VIAGAHRLHYCELIPDWGTLRFPRPEHLGSESYRMIRTESQPRKE